MLAVWYLQRGSDLTLRAVADHLHVAAAYVTVEVARLVDKGLLTKRPDPLDRRAVGVELTASAREMLAPLVPMLRDVNTSLLAGVSLHELDSVHRFFKAIIANGYDAIGTARQFKAGDSKIGLEETITSDSTRVGIRPSHMSFDERQFRDALGQFATGVAVVTAQVDGVKMAMTVSSFNAVSLRPPLVLFSIARSVQSFGLWQRASSFAVMILQEGQSSLSNRFAPVRREQMARYRCRYGHDEAPVLPTWLACFECTVYARYDGGDHEIVVGEVVNLRSSSLQSPGPLVFYGGRYRALSNEGGYGTAPGDLWLHGWWQMPYPISDTVTKECRR